MRAAVEVAAQLELAMTGVVVTGVLLFGAGLLHIGLGPSGLRDGVMEALYALSSLSFAGTVLSLGRAVWRVAGG